MEEESRQLTEYLATKTDEVNTQRAEHDKLLEELKQSRYEVCRRAAPTASVLSTGLLTVA